MKIELNEHEALTLYRLLCRWESTGELTVGVGEEKSSTTTTLIAPCQAMLSQGRNQMAIMEYTKNIVKKHIRQRLFGLMDLKCWTRMMMNYLYGMKLK